MGQGLVKATSHRYCLDYIASNPRVSYGKEWQFPDLNLLPREIGLKILSNLGAKDLRTVETFWYELATDETLWKALCIQSWGFCTAYECHDKGPHFWRTLYNKLELATDRFNTYLLSDTPKYSGLEVFQSLGILSHDPYDIARFIAQTDLLKTSHVVAVFQTRSDVFVWYVNLHNFSGSFIPAALRSFFFKLSISTKRQSMFIINVLDVFSKRYCECNPEYHKDAVLILVHSLNLLSNDLCNPSIQNKMSKREFIKNTLQALEGTPHAVLDSEYLGHAYDNVYLLGHIAPERLAF